jgi:hypothetical protein
MARLTDKNVETLMVAAKECDPQGIGYGDVMLLCEEVQTRRKNGENVPTVLLGDRLLERLQEGSEVNETTRAQLLEHLKSMVPKQAWEVPEAVTNATLCQELVKRIKDGEGILDSEVLALFHALQGSGYFQTTCVAVVDRESLKKLLHAVSSPAHPHLFLEMQATRGMPTGEGEPLNPIDQLIVDLRRPINATA